MAVAQVNLRVHCSRAPLVRWLMLWCGAVLAWVTGLPVAIAVLARTRQPARGGVRVSLRYRLTFHADRWTHHPELVGTVSVQRSRR